MPVPSFPGSRPRPRATGVEVCVGTQPTLALEAGQGTVRVGLVMPVVHHVVDVTVHPAAACTALLDAADRTRTPRGDAEAHVRNVLGATAGRAGAWQAPAEAPLVGALGGAAFPLLAAAYSGGRAPLAEVPRWATAVLACPDARTGAVSAFGPKATRPVVAALARSLLAAGGDTVNLSGLALALMGVRVLEPDRLVRVLGAPAPAWSPDGLPEPALIRVAQPVTASWGPARTERVLSEAATRPDGLSLLARTMRYAHDAGGHGPRRLPNRLSDLHDAYRMGVATDPGPRPRALPAPATVAPRPPRPRGAAPGRRPGVHAAGPDGDDGGHRGEAQEPAPHNPLYAPPAGLPPVHPHERLATNPAVRALHGATTEDLRLVVPSTAGDLARWSGVLRNCLHEYGPAVAGGHSTIIGVERVGNLCYALELNPQGVVRQFVGPANRPPRPADRLAIVRLLAQRGVIEADDPRNRVWLTS